MILSKAREIINEYIYKLEENGVEVLYSNVDSIFIRKSDLDKFKSLIGNIGDDLGNFHFEYSNISKALFIEKGFYVLKFSDGSYKLVDMFQRNNKLKINTNI